MTHSKTEKENMGNLSQNLPPVLLEVRVLTCKSNKILTVKSEINIEQVQAMALT
jgi:hypothetical protein